MALDTATKIGDCITALHYVNTSVHFVIDRIQKICNDSHEDKAVFISVGPVTAANEKPAEYWFLRPESVQILEHTGRDAGRYADISIVGSGIHGYMMCENPCHPIYAAEYYNSDRYTDARDQMNNYSYYIELGTQTIMSRDGVFISNGHPIDIKTVIGMGTSKFGDNPDWMQETPENYIDSAIRSIDVNYIFTNPFFMYPQWNKSL